MKLHGWPDELRTERLLMRSLADTDLDEFVRMNADPRVMEHFPSCLTRAESEAAMVRWRRAAAEHGVELCAVEVPGVTRFAGVLGLAMPSFPAHFTPCVEVGWRLLAEHQGRGYATEGALAALHVGFERMGLEEIVAMTIPRNRASWRVMEKLGMLRDPADDFEHPMVTPGSPIRPHILYRLGATRFRDLHGELPDAEATARALARSAHAAQRYGEAPYLSHLASVRGVLREFGHEGALALAAWLHDAVEDTALEREEIERIHGSEVAALVWAVTGVGETRKERVASAYAKMRAHPAAVTLKLADRIANSEASRRNNPRLHAMYREEMPGFEAALGAHGDPAMWSRLRAALA
ncbi:MAG: GNAT family N-acetyltransferase [Polyangiaceae bacterium]